MRWLTVDPGDTTGWVLWDDTDLVDAGQTPNWEFVREVTDAFAIGPMYSSHLPDPARPFRGVRRIVCEDFLIYPWKCKDLAFNDVMTARVIGALQWVAQLAGVDFVLQDAKIKETAVAGGAQELFLEPIDDNRHANDAIMHGTFYVQTVLLNPSNARVVDGRLVPRGERGVG